MRFITYVFEVGVWTTLAMSIVILVISFSSGDVTTDQIHGLPAISLEKSEGKLDPIVMIYGPGWFCTGTVVAENYVLTAAHCISKDDGDKLSKAQFMVCPLGPLMQCDMATAAALDHDRDVGLLLGKFKRYQYWTADWSGKTLNRSSQVLACGFPAGQQDMFCSTFKLYGNYFFQLMGKGGIMFRGMSGGPVISYDSGMIIGVNSAVSTDFCLFGPLVGFLEGFVFSN